MESRLPLLPAEEKLLPLVPEVDSELEQEKLPLKPEASATEACSHQQRPDGLVELHELLEREKANEQATLFQHGIGLLLRRARFPVLADARHERRI